jgi:hypothetical protein
MPKPRFSTWKRTKWTARPRRKPCNQSFPIDTYSTCNSSQVINQRPDTPTCYGILEIFKCETLNDWGGRTAAHHDCAVLHKEIKT